MAAPEPLKLVWADRQLEFELTNQRFKIGRGAHNEIQIPDQLVSSNHAILHNGVLSDKGSTNGTFVNGEALQKTEKKQLKPGDVIMFGDTKFTVERGNPHAPKPPTPGDDSPSSSDEEEPSRPKASTGTIKKQPEESPISWHPALPSNGAPKPDVPKARPPVRPAYNTGLSKVNSKERKLEEEIDKLKHQLYYGDREEKMATGQLMVVRQEIEALKKQLNDKNTQISSWAERYQKLEMKEKAYDDQVQYLMKQLTKVEARQAEQQAQGNREEPQAKLAREQTEAALKQDREQAALIYKKILANQVALTQRMDESSARMNRTLLFLNLIVLLLAIFFIASNHQHIQSFVNSFLQNRG